MKPCITPLIAAALCVASASCSRNSEDAKLDNCINEFDVSQTIHNADRIYRLITPGDTTYVDISASIHWPRRLGNANLDALRDSLIRITFGDTVSHKIKDALHRYLTDTSIFTDGIDSAHITPVDSIPGGDMMRTYFTNVSATVNELSESLITYNISSEVFLGGAHPLSSAHPFTYDLRKERILTNENMFRVPADSILPVVKNALARQLEVSPAGLERAGIFTQQFTFLGYPYIQGDVIYFHYNPYDIAPYSMGQIDIAVYPYELEQYLTPETRSLFNYNF